MEANVVEAQTVAVEATNPINPKQGVQTVAAVHLLAERHKGNKEVDSLVKQADKLPPAMRQLVSAGLVSFDAALAEHAKGVLLKLKALVQPESAALENARAQSEEAKVRLAIQSEFIGQVRERLAGTAHETYLKKDLSIFTAAGLKGAELWGKVANVVTVVCDGNATEYSNVFAAVQALRGTKLRTNKAQANAAFAELRRLTKAAKKTVKAEDGETVETTVPAMFATVEVLAKDGQRIAMFQAGKEVK